MSVCPRLACSVGHRRGSGGKELIHAFDQKPADRITKVDLVLMAGGTSRVETSSAAVCPSGLTLAGGSDWLWLESTCL